MTNLDFEKQSEALLQKIDELKTFSSEHDLDLSTEIDILERKFMELTEERAKNLTSWEKVQIARHQMRPTTLDYIPHLFEDFIEFHGDRNYADDPAIVGGIALFNGEPVTVIGNQKGHNTKENIYRRFGMPQPEGYRKALRLMKQAEKFNRPIITLINTAGAYPGKEAEERGQSEAIARNLIEMAHLQVPVISIVIGEGGSGGALALGIANKIYMLEHSFYSVISPEGAASILWKDASQAQTAAETMKISASHLLAFGIADDIIKEPIGAAHKDVKEQAKLIKETIEKALNELKVYSKEEIVEHRFNKFRGIGVFSEG